MPSPKSKANGAATTALMLRLLAGFLVALNGYFYAYGLFRGSLGIYYTPLDEILGEMASLFTYTKLFALLLLALSIQANPEKKKMKFKVSRKRQFIFALLGLGLFFVAGIFLSSGLAVVISATGYLLLSGLGFLLLLVLSTWIPGPRRVMGEGFPQNEERMENEYSVNFETEYIYKNRLRRGFINVINPFRASLVMGTPGSGKSFAVLIPAIKQMIAKGYAAYIYDFKYPDLSEIAFNALRFNTHAYSEKYGVVPKFCVINFDDPSGSLRCNPIHNRYINDLTDCSEAAQTIMYNLNRTWPQKQGDFFVESAINYLTGIIGFLWIYEKGKYCSLPHAIEFCRLPYDSIFPILMSYPELETIMSPFMDAFDKQAMDQLTAQVSSAKIGVGRLSSELLYWAMSGDDFDLNINDPKSPKILCVGNNPDRQKIYGAALALYNATLLRLINKKKRVPCMVVIDELPTMFVKGIDNLIATARSNKIATWLGIQDLSQLIRDYGDKEAVSIFNTIGNIFSGQVVAQTAKMLQSRFGQIRRERLSISRGSKGKTISTSSSLEHRITEGEISNMSQGYFAGSVADNFGEEIEEKIFHARVMVDMQKLKVEEDKSTAIPKLSNFASEDDMKAKVKANFKEIKADVKRIEQQEIARLANDPELSHLLSDEFLENVSQDAAVDLADSKAYEESVASKEQEANYSL